jgi:hypothetical protein
MMMRPVARVGRLFDPMSGELRPLVGSRPQFLPGFLHFDNLFLQIVQHPSELPLGSRAIDL